VIIYIRVSNIKVIMRLTFPAAGIMLEPRSEYKKVPMLGI